MLAAGNKQALNRIDEEYNLANKQLYFCNQIIVYCYTSPDKCKVFRFHFHQMYVLLTSKYTVFKYFKSFVKKNQQLKRIETKFQKHWLNYLDFSITENIRFILENKNKSK